MAPYRWRWGQAPDPNCGGPLGITIIGGLIVSQMLTGDYTTPVVYLYFDRLQHWWAGTKHPEKQNEPRKSGLVMK